MFFYAFTIAFAYTHLTNYSNSSLIFYILSPLIVLPQFCGGVIMAYLRIKLGFIWGLFTHSLFNASLFFLMISFTTELITDQKNQDFSLNIEEVFMTLGEPSKIEVSRRESGIFYMDAKNVNLKDVLKELKCNTFSGESDRIYNVKVEIFNPSVSADSLLNSTFSTLH